MQRVGRGQLVLKVSILTITLICAFVARISLPAPAAAPVAAPAAATFALLPGRDCDALLSDARLDLEAEGVKGTA